MFGGSYDEKCDVWSLGVCLFCMKAGYLPYSSTAAPEHIIHDVRAMNFELFCSPMMADLLEKMLEPRPNLRIGMLEISRHPWMLGTPEPGKVVPKPIVFYEIEHIDDIKKFKRRNVVIIDKVVQEACETLKIDKETLVSELNEGLINDHTCMYYVKMCPCKEKPQLPKIPILPPASMSPKIARPQVPKPPNVKCPVSRKKRFSLGNISDLGSESLREMIGQRSDPESARRFRRRPRRS